MVAPQKKSTGGIPRDTYAAFLRGINVGGRTVVKMDVLRRELEALGLENVKTVLASGNALFDVPAGNPGELSRRISAKLRETCGREVLVLVRPLDDLRKLEARQPFKDIRQGAGTRLFVTFLRESDTSPALPDYPPDAGYRFIDVFDGVICSVLDERPGIGAVQLMGAIEREFGKDVTTRTWDTVVRLLKTADR